MLSQDCRQARFFLKIAPVSMFMKLPLVSFIVIKLSQLIITPCWCWMTASHNYMNINFLLDCKKNLAASRSVPTVYPRSCRIWLKVAQKLWRKKGCVWNTPKHRTVKALLLWCHQSESLTGKYSFHELWKVYGHQHMQTQIREQIR